MSEPSETFMAELQELCRKHRMTMGGGGALARGARLLVTFRPAPEYQPGDTVTIGGQETTLVSRCNDVGGWIVRPSVEDFRMWNEDIMELKNVV